VADWQEKENPTYVLLFADLDNPCLWDRPSPIEKASHSQRNTNGAQKYRRNGFGEYLDQD
jgi:hypothetical protein